MINLSRTNNTRAINSGQIPVYNFDKELKEERRVLTCDFEPEYGRYDIKTAFKLCYQTLTEFKQEFYPVKSATYLCELIKKARRHDNDTLVSELEEKRETASRNIRVMRKKVYQRGQTRKERVEALENYIKENGSYMNCGECADLMQKRLHKKGIKAEKVRFQTTNKEGVRTNYAEHVFNLANADKNADISNPATWGKDAVIVDGWLGICMKPDNAIEYYKDFFKTNPKKHDLEFEYSNF